MPERRRAYLFLASLIASCLLGGAVVRRHDVPPEQRTSRIAEGVATRYVSTHVRNEPSAARAAGQFWLSNFYDHGDGVAVDVVGNADLRDSMFPGYGADLDDAALWTRYQSYEALGESLWSPLVQPPGAPFRLLSTSWGGCMEILVAHGADVVILGTSEVFRGVVPALLQAQLPPRADGRPLRVLQCATLALGTEMVERFATLATRAGVHVPTVLWGFSLWQIFSESPSFAGYRASHARAIEHFEVLHSPMWQVLEHYLPTASWNDVGIPTLSQLVHGSETAVPPPLTGADSQADELDRFVFRYRTDSAVDEDALAHLAMSHVARHPMFDGATDRTCANLRDGRDVHRAAEVLSELADEVWVYRAPVSPQMRRAAPDCFEPIVDEVLESLASPHLHVRTDGWEAYALTWHDFVMVHLDPTIATFDPNHPNYAGAVKETASIARWMSSELR